MRTIFANKRKLHRGGRKDGGGGPKTAKPHQTVPKKIANRTEFYQNTETADTNEAYRNLPHS